MTKNNKITKIKPKYNKKLAAGKLRFDLLVFESAAILESKTTCNLEKIEVLQNNISEIFCFRCKLSMNTF